MRYVRVINFAPGYHFKKANPVWEIKKGDRLKTVAFLFLSLYSPEQRLRNLANNQRPSTPLKAKSYASNQV